MQAYHAHGLDLDISADHPAESVEFADNPFRDDPHPTVAWSVKHFGLVGLLVCALAAGLARWLKSVQRSARHRH
jgi:hypothetical protein